ncbi:hypothetical protein [Glaciecola sp. SC05]|uniref:hypothetical protein n=1 Tax=Glaciecola sp. SC05 TaxID=1987355 RepID=UPI0035286C35
MELKQKQFLVKLILTLETNHNGCKQEVINMLKEELGLSVAHNSIREMINTISQKQINEFLENNKLL